MIWFIIQLTIIDIMYDKEYLSPQYSLSEKSECYLQKIQNINNIRRKTNQSIKLNVHFQSDNPKTETI